MTASVPELFDDGEVLDEPVVERRTAQATLATAFIAVTLAQIVNAMPAALNGTFQTEFQASSSQIIWIQAAFMIPLVAFELTFGLLGDRFGRRRLLFFGAALVILGSTINALVPLDSIWLLFVGQAFNGLGAGLLFPMSLSLVTSVSPSPAARAKGIAAWAGFLSLGAVIAPLLGGFTASGLTVTDATGAVVYSGWHVAFWVAAAIGLVTIVLNTRAHESTAGEARRIDVPGQVTMALGLIALLYATTQGSDPTVGWDHWTVITGYVAGAALIIAFVIIEATSKSPLIHLSVFKNRQFAVASIVAVVGMFAFLTYCFSMSIWTTGIEQLPAWTNGMLMVFVQGPGFLLIPLTGILLRKVSPQWLLTIGFTLIAAGAYHAATFEIRLPGPDGPTADWTVFILPSLLVGLGFWLTVSSITAAAVNTVPPAQQGMASATTNLFRDLGFSLGPVVGGAIAFSVAATLFAPQIAGIVEGMQALPPEFAGQLVNIPPIGVVTDPSIAATIAQTAGPQDVGPVLGTAGAALGGGFQAAFLAAGIAATVSALVSLFGLFGTRASIHVEAEL